MDAEMAHHFTINSIKKIQKKSILSVINCVIKSDEKLKVNRMGLTFRNPVGLAAGLDKNAEVFPFFDALGFGFVEVGTITPRPQEGNPRPRLFRLKKDLALLNRMGFNNVGAVKAAKNIEDNLPLKKGILGINIGKNKDTNNEDAYKDYRKCAEILYNYADYFVVNVSSPNTPGLRNLLDKEPLEKILYEVQCVLNGKSAKKIPLLLKISPDMEPQSAEDIIDVCIRMKLSGIIATNTTIDRNYLHGYSKEYIEKLGSGGISGKPLKEKSNRWLMLLGKNLPGDFTIVGSGGIINSEDAREKFKYGAHLIQLYTGLIYNGPDLLPTILKTIKNE
jgi:dihydroorotate dehydrogenase